ncbi:MAG TPA: hypothetical protein IAB68_05880 [Candidatus Aphodocola excrementigallinarum]|uniref:Uncharacterized protein n=1 Tax=Candidatus Aphodocola excrementigallinarum TaxID=2840670 RepID=A0A9D1LIA3_9FIRM|nr:hypothetical protein [Candidatus Aphodocola excrementigallinarum]
MRDSIEEVTNYVADQLKHSDFTAGEVADILRKRDIKPTEKQMDLITKRLQQKGFDYIDDFYDYDREGLDYTTDEEYSEREYEDSLVSNLSHSESEYSTTNKRMLADDLTYKLYIEKFKKEDKKCDYDDLHNYITSKCMNDKEFFDYIFKNSYSDKKFLNVVYEGYMVHLNFVRALSMVRVQDKKIRDFTRIPVPQVKKTMLDITDVLDEQVKNQNENSDYSRAAINLALDELGKDAKPEDIMKRSLEIIDESKKNGDIKSEGGMGSK